MDVEAVRGVGVGKRRKCEKNYKFNIRNTSEKQITKDLLF